MSLHKNEFSPEEDLPLTDGFGADGGCDRYSLLLTALFDGEASAAEEVAARAHLARCVRCADMWRFWSQTRGVWRATPPATIPSGLLLRILMACRLAALRRAKTGAHAQTKIAGRSTRQDQPASLAAAFEAPPVPSHLRDAILQRTVGATVNSAPPMIVMPPMSTRRSPWLSSALVKRATRWAAPVAVPAALVLMASISGQLPDNGSTLMAPSTPQTEMTVASSNVESLAAEARRRSALRTNNASQASSPDRLTATKHDASESLIADMESAVLQSQRGARTREASAEGDSGTARSIDQSVFPLSANDKAVQPVSVKLASRPAREWPSAGASLAANTQTPVSTDGPAYADGVAPASNASKAAEVPQDSRSQFTPPSAMRPSLGLVRASFAPRISQPTRGRNAVRVPLRSTDSVNRDALLKTSTIAMRSRLRASDPLADIPKRGAAKSLADDAFDSDVAFVSDMPDGDDSRRLGANEADELRSIVNEYRATVMADEENSGAPMGSSSSNESL